MKEGIEDPGQHHLEPKIIGGDLNDKIRGSVSSIDAYDEIQDDEEISNAQISWVFDRDNFVLIASCICQRQSVTSYFFYNITIQSRK